MELKFPHAANLRSSSSFSFLSVKARPIVPCNKPFKSSKFPSFIVKLAKRKPETSKGLQKESKGSKGLQGYSKGSLSQILRTEAAVKGIERKANSAKYNTLWPKAVLEALEEAISSHDWESALKIFELLRKQQWYQPRCQTYTKLLRMLGKCKQPEQASLLFDKLYMEGLTPTIDVYSSLVGAYGLSGHFDEAFRTLDEMKSITDCKPDIFTYSILINCCTKLHRFDLIDGILSEMLYLGVECSTVTYNTIIDGYGKAKMFELMENSLTDMIETTTCLPDIFTLNSFIGAYGNAGKIEEMQRWYDEFQHMGIKPDTKTFNILIKSYGKAGMYDKMVSVMEYMEKRFFSPTIVTFNIVIEIFGKAGKIENMENIFRAMKYRGMKPNSVTYCSLVSGYSKAKVWKRLRTILKQIENSDVVLDTPFFNCIISAYGQAGELRKMEDMFLQMEERKCKPDHITFATMIQAYKAKGMVKEAQELEIKMLDTKEKSVTRLIEGRLYDE